MESKIVHMSLSLPGMLSDWGRWKSALAHPDGRPMRPAEARQAVEELIAQGVRVVPLFGTPCEGWSDQEGCPGHPQPVGLAPTLQPAG